MSPSGNSGGLIRVIEGDVGTRFIALEVSSAEPGSNIQCFIVFYKVDLVNGGNNFRIGRMVPGLRFIRKYEINDSTANDIFEYYVFYTAIISVFRRQAAIK